MIFVLVFVSRDSELDQNLSGDLRKKFSSDLNEIWYVGRGRWVMHDGMPYDRIQGQGHSGEVDRQSPTGLIFYYLATAWNVFQDSLQTAALCTVSSCPCSLSPLFWVVTKQCSGFLKRNMASQWILQLLSLFNRSIILKMCPGLGLVPESL